MLLTTSLLSFNFRHAIPTLSKIAIEKAASRFFFVPSINVILHLERPSTCFTFLNAQPFMCFSNVFAAEKFIMGIGHSWNSLTLIHTNLFIKLDCKLSSNFLSGWQKCLCVNACRTRDILRTFFRRFTYEPHIENHTPYNDCFNIDFLWMFFEKKNNTFFIYFSNHRFRT